ncbi:hypothetical protein FACS1894159_10020 [Bacteroidia bacterium]|nr:hypothetical protein FACS1894159_10020 [Bacteroidia bacterium]
MKTALRAAWVAASFLAVGPVAGQSLEGLPVGVVEKEGLYTVVNPRTVVRATVVVQREAVRKGPYARFSQKYLGVIAPLNDRDGYSVRSATIGWVDPRSDASPSGDLPAVAEAVSPPQPVSPLVSDTSFVRLPLNIASSVAKSPEEMASDAAAAIFAIRKHRAELISGDAGEHVFGAGLATALEELGRQEQEYLELFLGKQFIQQVARTFEVVPQAGVYSYTVCRLSETGGLMDASQMGGRPITLALNVEQTEIPAPPLPKKYASLTTLLFPAIAVGRLSDGSRELASCRLPVYQYGTRVDVAK